MEPIPKELQPDDKIPETLERYNPSNTNPFMRGTDGWVRWESFKTMLRVEYRLKQLVPEHGPGSAEEIARLSEQITQSLAEGEERKVALEYLEAQLKTARETLELFRVSFERFRGMFCEHHLDTTLADANGNDLCPLCKLERREQE